MSHPSLPHKVFTLALLVLASPYSQARPGEDQIHYSPDHQVAVLELYTSEGCSSCPPADRWLSRLHKALIEEDKVVPLALHITYWDYIGWNDRYAHRRFDQRQRHIAQRARSRSIYTPQFVLNGRDYRRLGSFVKDLQSINKRPAKVRLGLAIEDTDDPRSPIVWLYSQATDKTVRTELSLYLAIFENALQSDVDAGENQGKQLKHDRVVRHLYGPFKTGTGQYSHSIPLHIAPEWRRNALGIALFAQDSGNGKILQAVQLRLNNSHQ